MKKITFDICPVGKPRMTQSDKWNDRPAVLQYFAFKQELNLLANKRKYRMGDTLDIVFILPMPASWSIKKRSEFMDKPHQQKPDVDNLVKAFMDAMSADDAGVWKIRASKIWGTDGQINVFTG